ncbi:conjugal transfer protein TraM [Legionella pneumophila serogroup 1]
MSERLDKAIQEIAIKHGVALSKDDPILILQTMNDRLIEETRQAQAEMLARFREEMEAISSRWKDDAKEKAEKVLNAALTSSKVAMAKSFQDSTQELGATVKQLIAESFSEALGSRGKNQRHSRSLTHVTAATVLGVCLFFSWVVKSM